MLVFVVNLSHKYVTANPLYFSTSPWFQNSSNTLYVHYLQISQGLYGLETSAEWSNDIMQISLSLSLGSKSVADNLPFNLARSAKCWELSVWRIMLIILSLDFLNSSLLKCTNTLQFSYYISKKAEKAWWFSRGDLSLYLMANSFLELIK